MGIVNRRNAVLGWAVWQIGKRKARRKAKEVVPSGDAVGKGRAALAAGVAAFFGVLAFWRRRKSSSSEPPE